MPAPLIPIAITIGRIAATQLGKKQAAKVGAKTAQNVAKNLSTKTPTGRGVAKTVKAQGPSTVTSKTGSKSVTPKTAKITFKSPDMTSGQLKAIKAALAGKNYKTIEAAQTAAIKAAAPIIGKTKAKTAIVTAGIAVPTSYKAGQKSQKKKK
jgi:hypothetical protein